jgi:putative transposase
MRKDVLVVGEVYHIFSKSIAGFIIFNNNSEFLRMIGAIHYYQEEKPPIKFSKSFSSSRDKQGNMNRNIFFSDKERLVEIIAYCLMPTHVHLVLKQLKKDGISIFMNRILNSYTRYFNIKHKRKGPLWESRFRNVLVDNDEQLLHLTRYIHLNPVTASLTDGPEEWLASSYKEYLLDKNARSRICKFDEILNIEPNYYRNFVENRISYQRELAKIKDFLLEEPLFFSAPLSHHSSYPTA